MLPIWSPVIGMIFSQNPSSHSSRESHRRAERRVGPAYLGQCRHCGHPSVRAGPLPWHTASACSGERSRRVVSTYALSQNTLKEVLRHLPYRLEYVRSEEHTSELQSLRHL